jgi:hypothetical protein
MADTTTIEITEEQRDRLSERKQHDRESYKAVIARLLDDTNVVSVSKQTRERFEDARESTQDESVPAMTQDLYLDALLDTWEAAGNGYYTDDGTTTASDPVGVDKEELAREVARQVDYAELANQVATELEGRMR